MHSNSYKQMIRDRKTYTDIITPSFSTWRTQHNYEYCMSSTKLAGVVSPYIWKIDSDLSGVRMYTVYNLPKGAKNTRSKRMYFPIYCLTLSCFIFINTFIYRVYILYICMYIYIHI